MFRCFCRMFEQSVCMPADIWTWIGVYTCLGRFTSSWTSTSHPPHCCIITLHFKWHSCISSIQEPISKFLIMIISVIFLPLIEPIFIITVSFSSCLRPLLDLCGFFLSLAYQFWGYVDRLLDCQKQSTWLLSVGDQVLIICDPSHR